MTGKSLISPKELAKGKHPNPESSKKNLLSAWSELMAHLFLWWFIQREFPSGNRSMMVFSYLNLSCVDENYFAEFLGRGS